ncbi:hypothetical protein D910_01721 [Dendroctonus ponderosae]
MNRTLFGIALLGLCICLSIADEPACPENDDGQAEFLEDPEDCNSYYECSNGRAIHFSCPPGTYYDGNKKCQWPENVDCGTRPTTLEPPTTEPSTDPPTTDLPKPGPVLVR